MGYFQSDSVLPWRIGEVMARHRITNKALAKRVGRHETSVSRWRTAEEMPRLSGSELGALCQALSDLAGVKILPSNLLQD